MRFARRWRGWHDRWSRDARRAVDADEAARGARRCHPARDVVLGHRPRAAADRAVPDGDRADRGCRGVTGERGALFGRPRSEEHTSELQSLMRISYAVFCLKKKKILNISKESTSNDRIKPT